jgi:hypothetical protein
MGAPLPELVREPEAALREGERRARGGVGAAGYLGARGGRFLLEQALRERLELLGREPRDPLRYL